MLKKWFRTLSKTHDGADSDLFLDRQKLQRLELIARRDLSGLLQGSRPIRLRGQGMEFHALTPYQPGDDPRLLDWNVTARHPWPHLRQFRQEQNTQLLVLADISPSLGPRERQLQLEVLAMLSFAAQANRDKVGLIAFSDRVELVVPPATGRGKTYRMLDRLQKQRSARAASDPTQALELASRLLRRSSMVVLLSDFHYPLPHKALRNIAVQHDLLAFLLHPPDHLWERARGVIGLEDRETGKAIVWTGSERGQSLPRSLAQTRDIRLKELSRLRIDCAPLVTGQRLLPALQLFFRQRRL